MPSELNNAAKCTLNSDIDTSLRVMQVLDIVYFGSHTKPGGFYPNGVAGKYKTSCWTPLIAYQQLRPSICKVSAAACKTSTT